MEFSFRLVTKQDFSLLALWLGKPHVKKWWRDAKETLDEVHNKYGGPVVVDDPTDYYVSEVGGTAIGFIQSYMVDNYPEHADTIQLDNAAGIDLFIGEEDFIGKGYGAAMLTQFVNKVIRNTYKTVDFVVADPEVANLASIRAFEKAGFQKGAITPGEYGPEQLMIFRL